MPPTSDYQRREEQRNRFLGFVVLLFIAAAVFLLLPGMALMALVADMLGLPLAPSQMWAFSFALSVCIFAVLRACASSTRAAGKRYLVISGTLATVLVALLFGFQAAFAARWVARFVPPSEAAASRSSNSSASPGEELAGGGETPEPVEVRRALPVSAAAAPLKPFASAPVEAAAVPVFYSVAGIPRGDALNVRRGPGVSYDVTESLPNGYRNIQVLGAPVMNDTTEWVNIQYGDRSGWVRRQYLKPD